MLEPSEYEEHILYLIIILFYNLLQLDVCLYFLCTDFHISPVAFLRSVALEITKKIFKDFFYSLVRNGIIPNISSAPLPPIAKPQLLLKTNQMKTW